MPAKSKKQQRFMGMVHAVQKGEISPPSEEVADVAGSISKSDAEEFASTKHKGLPEKKSVTDRVAAFLNKVALGLPMPLPRRAQLPAVAAPKIPTPPAAPTVPRAPTPPTPPAAPAAPAQPQRGRPAAMPAGAAKAVFAPNTWNRPGWGLTRTPGPGRNAPTGVAPSQQAIENPYPEPQHPRKIQPNPATHTVGDTWSGPAPVRMTTQSGRILGDTAYEGEQAPWVSKPKPPPGVTAAMPSRGATTGAPRPAVPAAPVPNPDMFPPPPPPQITGWSPSGGGSVSVNGQQMSLGQLRSKHPELYQQALATRPQLQQLARALPAPPAPPKPPPAPNLAGTRPGAAQLPGHFGSEKTPAWQLAYSQAMASPEDAGIDPSGKRPPKPQGPSMIAASRPLRSAAKPLSLNLKSLFQRAVQGLQGDTADTTKEPATAGDMSRTTTGNAPGPGQVQVTRYPSPRRSSMSPTVENAPIDRERMEWAKSRARQRQQASYASGYDPNEHRPEPYQARAVRSQRAEDLGNRRQAMQARSSRRYFNRYGSAAEVRPMTKQAMITKMSVYLDWLAQRRPDGKKLVKLAQEFKTNQNLVEAIQTAYPTLDQKKVTKIARYLVHCLHTKLQKVAMGNPVQGRTKHPSGDISATMKGGVRMAPSTSESSNIKMSSVLDVLKMATWVTRNGKRVHVSCSTARKMKGRKKKAEEAKDACVGACSKKKKKIRKAGAIALERVLGVQEGKGASDNGNKDRLSMESRKLMKESNTVALPVPTQDPSTVMSSNMAPPAGMAMAPSARSWNRITPPGLSGANQPPALENMLSSMPKIAGLGDWYSKLSPEMQITTGLGAGGAALGGLSGLMSSPDEEHPDRIGNAARGLIMGGGLGTGVGAGIGYGIPWLSGKLNTIMAKQRAKQLLQARMAELQGAKEGILGQ